MIELNEPGGGNDAVICEWVRWNANVLIFWS